jgi:hypothetical protein
MKNPLNFHDDLETGNLRDATGFLRRYQYAVFRDLARVYGYSQKMLSESFEQDSSDAWTGGLKYRIGNPELDSIFASRLRKVDGWKLLTNFKASPAWKEYLRIFDETRLTMFGLVFPVRHSKSWIIHNFGESIMLPGRVRHIVPSRVDGIRHFEIMPLQQFIEEKTKKE